MLLSRIAPTCIRPLRAQRDRLHNRRHPGYLAIQQEIFCLRLEQCWLEIGLAVVWSAGQAAPRRHGCDVSLWGRQITGTACIITYRELQPAHWRRRRALMHRVDRAPRRACRAAAGDGARVPFVHALSQAPCVPARTCRCQRRSAPVLVRAAKHEYEVCAAARTGAREERGAAGSRPRPRAAVAAPHAFLRPLCGPLDLPLPRPLPQVVREERPDGSARLQVTVPGGLVQRHFTEVVDIMRR